MLASDTGSKHPDNGRVTLSPADVGAMLARMPQPAAEQARTALGEVVTDTATLAALNIARAEASEAAGLEPRAAYFEPMAFDFDADAPEPDWLIGGLIERCTVNVQSGDTGAAKSIHWQDAAVRLVHGEPWIGHATVEPRKVLYVDEENPERSHARG